MKEATARIKINKLLEAAGWRFFADENGPANIQLEPKVTLKAQQLSDLGENFEKTSKGFIDFLLLDDRGIPLIVLEAKSEDKNPLDGKEQARKYAKSQNCRFVILSNGQLHYFWDLERGNPHLVTTFPKPGSVVSYKQVQPNPKQLIDEEVASDYIALTQSANYRAEAGWKNEAERPEFIKANNLCFLRPYQIEAVRRLQRAVKDGKDRFLFEMATGTGKTSTAAAVIKLFLRTSNAKRVLFLVDRLELEDQAKKSFVRLLNNDFKTVIYKENRDDWRHAEIVVTTVQSLLFNNKYQRLFSPTDFDLVISDEAHRSIGGNARAVFDYFVGYKLGLTATPRDFLKHYDEAEGNSRDPRETERRNLLDTYRTFGCDKSQPTFRYSLLDGVKEGYLINPTVVDARSDVTTKLLSEEGYTAIITGDDGVDQEENFKQTQFEKRFFSEATNRILCHTFLENALRDPISGELGKSIVFAVSQNHASKLVQKFNEMGHLMYPGRYKSDFAVQVTSRIPEAQQFTINFANNNLLGNANFLPLYRTSKARICVTVGMMTTGYDCPDILNIGLFRPVFSPTDFVQIKGRGTRKHDFRDQFFDEAAKSSVAEPNKTSFKLMDFFANCQYFEEDFEYDQVVELPRPGAGKKGKGGNPPPLPPDPFGTYVHTGTDRLLKVHEAVIGYDGMKIDRMLFQQFEDVVREDTVLTEAVEAGQWDFALEYVTRELFDKPNEYYNLEKLRKGAEVDRRLTLREILEKMLGLIPRFKSKDELLEEEFAKFIADVKPDPSVPIPAIKNYFKAYIVNDQVRHIIETKQFTDLATNPVFPTRDLKAVPAPYIKLVPEYVKDYVSLNQFVS